LLRQSVSVAHEVPQRPQMHCSCWAAAQSASTAQVWWQLPFGAPTQTLPGRPSEQSSSE
jgi:hypothetical protein